MRKNNILFNSSTQNGLSYFSVKLLTENVDIFQYQDMSQITLCLSGGIDSECMLLDFLKAKIPFKVVFLKFGDNLNMFDIQTNIDICQAKNIKYKFVDLDIINFFESGKYLDVSIKYECQSPQIAAHLWMLDQIDGTPFLSGNPMVPIWKDNHWYFVGLPGRLHSTYFKYFEINQRYGEPWYFLSSAHLVKKFLDLNCMKPYLNRLVENENQYTYYEKCKSYLQAGYNVKPRLDKFTGFELVRKYYDEKHRTTHGIAFDQLFRRPLERLFPFPDRLIQLIPNSYFSEVEHK